jgi:hypothetical protein
VSLEKQNSESSRQTVWRFLAVFCGICFLGACGGGGGGGNSVAPPASVTVSGRITFDRVPHDQVTSGLDYPSTSADAVRGATVEAIDPSGAILAAGATDGAGRYALSVLPDTSVRIRVKAQMLRAGSPGWNFQVIDNTQSLLYAMESTAFSSGRQNVSLDLRAESGWDGSSYTGVRVAAPFAILDTVYRQLQKVLAVDPGLEFPQLILNWSPLNRASEELNAEIGEIVTTAYHASATPAAIFILGDEGVDTDEYDAHVLAHEWGHYFEDQLARSDTTGGRHSIFGFFDPRLAFSEGWSNAWSAIALDDALYKDTAGFQQSSAFVFDIESNSTFNPGWYNESSVHSILYDIYDAAADGVDAIELGFSPIYEALTGGHADTTALTTVFSLLTVLKAAETPVEDGINALIEGQDIVGIGMDIWASLETNDAGTSDVLPLYSDLQPGGPPVTVCSLSAFGTFNGLSTRRFLRFRAVIEGTYNFLVTGPPGSDPDALLHDRGPIAIFQSENDGIESFSIQLSAGEYVLEVVEFGNLSDPGAGRVCFDVTVEQG